MSVIPNAEGTLTTPSVVGLAAGKKPLIGVVAKRQSINNPEYTIASVKLKLGSDWTINCGGIDYSAEEISALILEQLRKDAESYVGGILTGAVLTVPAYFSYVQRYALRKAAEIAGIKVLRILNEPTAASITYGLNRSDEQTVLIFDLGGGTFDVSLLDIGDNVCEVRATSGDNHLGGDNWDERLADYFTRLTYQRHGIDVGRSPEAGQRLKEAAEAAKIELSSALSTHVFLPFIAVTQDGPIHLDLTLTRAKFEEVTRETLHRCRQPINQVMSDANINPSDINHVILVGGSSRMPAVAQLVKEITGGKVPYRGLIPEGIVTGAALQAGVLTGQLKDFLLLDVIPLSLGIETHDGIFTKLIERNTTIPTKRSEIFTTYRDQQKNILFHIQEGEHQSAHKNRSLGVVPLEGLAPNLRNRPKVEVAFDVDANGVLNVEAKSLDTSEAASLAVNRDSVANIVKRRAPGIRSEGLEDTPVLRNMWIPAEVGKVYQEVVQAHGVNAVAVTAQRKVVAGCRDGAVRLWDPEIPDDPGRELGRHRGQVTAVAVTAQGKVVSGGDDGAARLWNPEIPDDPGLELGHHVRTSRFLFSATVVAVTAQGKVVSGGDDGAVRLWNPEIPDDPGRELGRHRGQVTAVAVTAQGKVVSGGDDGAVRLWNPEIPDDLGRELGHHVRGPRYFPSGVNTLAVTVQDKVVSGGGDGMVRLWDPDIPDDSGLELGHHNYSVVAVAVTKQGRVVSGDHEGVVRLWESRRPNDRGRELGEHGYGVTGVLVMPDERDILIASSSDGNALTLVQLPRA